MVDREEAVALSVDGDEAQDNPMYELFLGVMTVISLIVVFLQVVVHRPEVDAILTTSDSLFCVLFLFDFARSYRRARNKRAYLVGERPGRSLPHGLLDLLGSIPFLNILRVLRIFRVAPLARSVRAGSRRGLARELLARRAEGAVYVIVVVSSVVLLVGSSLIAFIEPEAPGSNIKTGGDAIWWAVVTITTVGYGDRYPVTEAGRLVGGITMAVGIGIFGVLTSYLSTIFLAPHYRTYRNDPSADATGSRAGSTDASLTTELAAIRAELAGLRVKLDLRDGERP